VADDRNAQDLVARSARSMVASAIRSIFEQPDEGSAREQLGRVVDGLRPRFPAVADLLADAEPDLLTHFTFPETHRRQIRSTSPLERPAVKGHEELPDRGHPSCPPAASEGAHSRPRNLPAGRR
jgi:hypothetical protein